MQILILILSLLIGVNTTESIPTPAGYTRVQTDGFGTYLRNIVLKQDKTVYLYNGRPKANQTAQYAVLDVPVGHQDLQQCADAVMRLRTEYLMASKQYDKIVFYSNTGKEFRFKPPYTEWHKIKYLDAVFANCNSASLEKQVKAKKMKDIQIGDVLIKGGFPGHVVIVIDVAVNAQGKKAYMIAQSYMPAQDIHILKGEDGPWYFVQDGDYVIDTPEYTFYSNQLKGW
jgi:hypothetical protein